MTRAHPFVLDGKRLIVPLYSDGFSFSLMAITDDWGQTWKTSTPLVGLGNIQPSIARKRDGTLVAYMRDNGPAPKRLMISRSTDRGDTWSQVQDTQLPNPGAGAEVRVARERKVGAHLQRSRTWPLQPRRVAVGRRRARRGGGRGTWNATPTSADQTHLGEYHYPSIIQAADGSLHATYSYFVPAGVGHARCRAAPAAQVDQARTLQRGVDNGHGGRTLACRSQLSANSFQCESTRVARWVEPECAGWNLKS